MIINIVLTTICHSLCAAASIIFFIAALMSGWDTGETMFAFMFFGIIQGAAISALGLLALRSRGFLQNWLTRSEERRVGKECRSRWSPYH